MAASEATIVEAGGRDLRVSSPDRVIFPKTERSGEVTKLDVVKYYLAVGDGIMRALERRPTTLERWPKGVHPGIVVSTREKGGGDAFFQKRIPRGAPGLRGDGADRVPLGPPRGRDLSHGGGRGRLGGPDGHDHVSPVAGSQREDVDHPDELRIDLDPQPGTDFADAVRVAAEARVLLDELGYAASPRPREAGASTSTSGSSPAGRSPTSVTPRSPSGASSSGVCRAR